MGLSLEIVTPEGIVWHDNNLAMITLPASNGEVGIMQGHIPIITTVNEGAILVLRENGSEESIAIDRGYARCMGNVVSVLTEAAIDVSKLSEEDIAKAKENAIKAAESARSSSSVDSDELEKIEALVRFTVAQELAKAKKRR